MLQLHWNCFERKFVDFVAAEIRAAAVKHAEAREASPARVRDGVRRLRWPLHHMQAFQNLHNKTFQPVLDAINARDDSCGSSFLKHVMQRSIVMDIVKRIAAAVQTDADIFCIQI